LGISVELWLLDKFWKSSLPCNFHVYITKRIYSWGRNSTIFIWQLSAFFALRVFSLNWSSILIPGRLFLPNFKLFLKLIDSWSQRELRPGNSKVDGKLASLFLNNQGNQVFKIKVSKDLPDHSTPNSSKDFPWIEKNPRVPWHSWQ